MAKAKSKFYAVAKGKYPYSSGIYNTWTEASEHVNGVSGARHHSFLTRNEAERWLKANLKRDDEHDSGALSAGAVEHKANPTRSNAVPAALAPAPMSSSSGSLSAIAPKHEQDQEQDSCTWYLCATKSAEEVIAREHISYFYRDVAIPLGNIPDVPIGAYDTRPPPRRFFDSDEEDETDDEKDILFLQSLSSSADHIQWEEEEYIPFSPSPPSTPLPTSGRSKRRKPRKFYAVPVGHLPGVYRTWADTEVQLIGFTDSYCKSDKDEGMAWLYYFSRYKRPRDYSDDEDVVGGVEQDKLETGDDPLAGTTSPERLHSRSSSRSSSPQLIPASSPPTSSPGHFYGQPALPLEGASVPQLAVALRNDNLHNSEDEFADDDSEWIDNVPGEELDRLEVQLLTSQQTATCSGASACTSEREFADADADSEWMDYLTDDEMGQIDSQQSS